jgi:hypothetical protein
MNHSIEEHQKMIYRIAWSFHFSTGVEWEELVSEAYLAWCKNESKYDENRGIKFSTFMYLVIQNHLNNYVALLKRKNPSLNNHVDLMEDMLIGDMVEREVMFRECLEDLGRDGKTICKIIFSSPSEFVHPLRPKKSRGLVQDHLRKAGMSWEQIWTGFREIKGMLATLG